MPDTTNLFEPNAQVHLEYYRYGAGEKALICFHGFGQEGYVFEPLTETLSDYTLYCVNLFFHGKSIRNNQIKYLEHSEWKQIFKAFLNQNGINRFSLLGYSLGGRYAASTLRSFGDQVDHFILIAADGLVKRFWYEFATTPIGLEQLFHFLMKNPKPFFIFLDFLERFNLMNSSTIKFSRTQLKDEKRRMLVYRSWVTLKKLRLKQAKLIQLINDSQFDTKIIFGEYDRVIDHRQHRSFIDKLAGQVIIIPSSHHELITNSQSEIAKILNT